MNPFITLTKINNEGDVDINVNHIVAYERRMFKGSQQKYTYILINGGSGCTREVEETPETIREMIKLAVLSIPFTGIKGA